MEVTISIFVPRMQNPQKGDKIGLLLLLQKYSVEDVTCCLYNKLITKDCCQEINSNLTQGIGLKKNNNLDRLNSVDPFQEEVIFFNAVLLKIAEKR